MARISSYYTLCPLIDQQNLLGVEPDSDSGCAIVTLGKNIVKRYKLQDLKQITSWSTKDRLTTAVIFDSSSGNYVAAFNGKNIRVWQEEETDLDSVKKYKFLSNVHTILNSKPVPPIVVMQNGSTASLEWALENRKVWNSDGILCEGEKILCCQLLCTKNQLRLGIFSKLDNVYIYYVVPLKKKNRCEDPEKLHRVEIRRPSEQLVGHVIVQDEDNAHLLTLWSHGRLYSYPLTKPATDSTPGSLISVITVVNTKHPVVLVALNSNTIAGYGGDVNEEGAILFIYNLQFKLVQAVQKLKLFTQDAKLWNVEDRLLLAANRHLAIAPYVLAPQRIEAVLGSTLSLMSKKPDDNDIVEVQETIIADWGTASKKMSVSEVPMKELKKDIASQVSAFLKEGLSDAAIHWKLIPELIKNEDTPSIIWCLDNLKDLPEDLLVRLVKLSLKDNIIIDTTTQNGDADVLVEKKQYRLLDRILNICFSNVAIVAYARRGLTFDEILFLLDYLSKKICEESFVCEVDPQDGVLKPKNFLYEWTKLVIDSNYQNYLLSGDEKVPNLFVKLKEAVEIQIQFIYVMEELRPLLQQVLDRKVTKPIPNDLERFYSIEEIKLY
ncbi:hypothetical protein QAD02_017828 [Eretmocerus hayati]|uniref:Uncharacterized protein n=1 Tax=Eretmocerus hayati TaxID=131215 RepID=A0ACC2PG88_9HYME|nr:hypothetical protein QAD02_017828 [Eretmocerus hayati]